VSDIGTVGLVTDRPSSRLIDAMMAEMFFTASYTFSSDAVMEPRLPN